MNSPEWYFAQAELLRGRADACLQLAQRLDGAALFDLHRYSGDATWQGPVAWSSTGSCSSTAPDWATPSTGSGPMPSD